MTHEELFSQMLRADELGIRLEMVGGLPIWEAPPVYRHQKHVERIAASIRASAAAFTLWISIFSSPTG